MTILFSSARPVKSAREPFGRGILPSHPVYRDPATLADRIEAAQFLNEGRADYDSPSDADLEQAVGEALAMGRGEAGVFGAY